MRAVVLLVAVAGCQQVFGLDDTVLSMSLSVAGKVLDYQGSPIFAVEVQWKTDPGLVSLATDTTNTYGQYTLTIPYTGTPLVGHLEAVQPVYVPIEIYLSAPLASDLGLTFALATTQDVATACIGHGVTCDPARAYVTIVADDDQGKPVAGVVAATMPSGVVRYDDSNNNASATATSTSSDGDAYVFDVPAGTVQVDASKTGWTFPQQTVFAPAAAVTVVELTGQ